MERESDFPELTDHVVILNCNEKVGKVVEEIGAGARSDPPEIILVCPDLALWEAHPDWHPSPSAREHFRVVEGHPTDPTDLARVNMARARAAVILADPEQGKLADARSTLVAVAIERQNPQVHTVMELIASINRVHLKSTEVNEVVCLGELSEKLIAQSCITPGVKNIFHHLLSSKEETNQILVLPVPEVYSGKTYRQIARRVILSGAPCILCGFGLQAAVSGGGEEGGAQSQVFVLNPRAHYDPGKDTILTKGDFLVVIGKGDSPLG